ncbi:hypothetical protein [Bacterioplanoides sp.]|uniref:hypothetical protein n=1 Tax=Bacterioplanoides sp. TaxID=2066072 RepID=UPI003AFF9765
MAKVNNPVVATLPCSVCNTAATLHETRRGKGKGLLYKRCECGCDQRTGAKIQTEWRQALTPRPGYEHLAEPKPEPEQPKEPAPMLESVQPEPVPEQPKKEPKQPEPKQPKGFGGFVVAALGFGIAIITMGRAGG